LKSSVGCRVNVIATIYRSHRVGRRFCQWSFARTTDRRSR